MNTRPHEFTRTRKYVTCISLVYRALSSIVILRALVVPALMALLLTEIFSSAELVRGLRGISRVSIRVTAGLHAWVDGTNCRMLIDDTPHKAGARRPMVEFARRTLITLCALVAQPER